MKAPYEAQNDVDDQGRPAGGYATGTGMTIFWQNGPLRDPETGETTEPNGAFVETVLDAVIQRIEHYNETEFRCRENSLAITHLQEAAHWLQARQEERTARGVEGTHKL